MMHITLKPFNRQVIHGRFNCRLGRKRSLFYIRLIVRYGVYDRERGVFLLPCGRALDIVTRLLIWQNQHFSYSTIKRFRAIRSICEKLIKCARSKSVVKIAPDGEITLRHAEVSSHQYEQFMFRNGLEEDASAGYVVEKLAAQRNWSDTLSHRAKKWMNKTDAGLDTSSSVH